MTLDELTDQDVEWDIGTIPAGATATAHLTLRAVSPGLGHISVQTESTAGDVQCTRKPCNEPTLTLIAVAPSAATTSRHSSHPTSSASATATPTPPSASASNQLANTGTSVPTLIWLAGILLATGALLTRPRRHTDKRS